MKAIEQYIHNYFGISQNDLSEIADLFEPRHLRKGEFLLKKADTRATLSFIKEGYIRLFDTGESGKEVTQWIATPDSFASDLSALIFQSKVRWNFQALTDCELYSISYENYQQIGAHVSDWDALEKMFIAKCFVYLEERIHSHLSLGAETRYQALFDEKPEMFNLVPLQHIASMLGMTPETFSRIRKKMTS